ncbi:MAG: S8 family peptidase [Elusimicrobiota bacterium]
MIRTIGSAVIAAFLAASAVHAEAPRGTHVVTYNSAAALAAGRQALESQGGRIISELPLIDALVVEFRGITPSLSGRLYADKTVENVELNTYRKWIEAAAPSVGAMRFPTAAGILDAAKKLNSAPGVAGEEAPPAARKDDPKRKEAPWGIERVKAPAVWETTRGKGVRVAIIDTGVDGQHPDLAANYVGGYNAVTPGEEQTDEHGHGTHVAGTIAAAANKKGVVGVAPEASIYGVKVLDGKGGGTIASIIGGLDWAVKNKMHVVNMSLGGPHSAAMHKAIKRAYAAGVTIVAAAGNDPNAEVSAPARYPETIAVSASTNKDELASFSTTGEEVDFIAPGHEILSDWPGSRMAELSGTSMASPHVAGLAALAHALGANGPSAIKSALTKAAVPVEGLSATQQGKGMIEADRWVK